MSDIFSAPPATPSFWVLIPSAGIGSRALDPLTSPEQLQVPKQYQVLAGLPMVSYTLAAFAGFSKIKKIVVVVAAGDEFFQSMQTAAQVVPCGGATRAESVANGLEYLSQQGAQDQDWVLVHDAARCLVTAAQIESLIQACAGDAVGGLLALPLPDTLKVGRSGRVDATLSRSDKWLAQTPQMFRLGLLRQALAQSIDEVTDESGAIEAMGFKPLLVAGSAQNFKITYPEDFALAEAVLRARAQE